MKLARSILSSIVVMAAMMLVAFAYRSHDPWGMAFGATLLIAARLGQIQEELERSK